jgi:uncharacterized protein (DUF736 family)
MATVGLVTKKKDGSFVGRLKTLSVDVPIEIAPVKNKVAPNGPDFMVTSQGRECGAAWIRIGQRSNEEYVSVSFAAPEFGSEPLFANLGKAAGQDDDDVFALIWNPKKKR